MEKNGEGFTPAIRYYNSINRYDVVLWIEVELGIRGEKRKKQDEIKFPEPINILAKNSEEIIDLLYEELTNAGCIKIDKVKFLDHFSLEVAEFEKIAWLRTQSYLPYLFFQLGGGREPSPKEKQIISTPKIYVTICDHFVKRDGTEFISKNLSSHYAKLYKDEKGEDGAKKMIDPIVQRICELAQ